MADSVKIYVGYDPREEIAWQVCRFSIDRHKSRTIDVFPLKQAALREIGLYTRETDAAATEFSLTRFLTPYLAAHDGWSMFVDCDFLFTQDIYRLLDSLDPSKAVHVVKHDYIPRNSTKMGGSRQSAYPRKNWSSMMVFNGRNDHVKALTPAVVNQATPAFLHRFSWLPHDDLIGTVDSQWNFLEGEYDRPESIPAAIHYTNGGPWFETCQTVDFGDLWIAERDRYQKLRSATP